MNETKRMMCIKCGEDYLEHQCILSELNRERCLCLNCWGKLKGVNKMTEYYKVCIFCSSSEIDEDGNYNDTGNMWDENPSKHFKTIDEAEQYIIDTFVLKEFSLEDINKYDELQGGYEETEDGRKFWIDQSISISKHIVEFVKFKKIKEVKNGRT